MKNNDDLTKISFLIKANTKYRNSKLKLPKSVNPKYNINPKTYHLNILYDLYLISYLPNDFSYHVSNITLYYINFRIKIPYNKKTYKVCYNNNKAIFVTDNFNDLLKYLKRI